MTQINKNITGRLAAIEAFGFAVKRRLAKRFKRNFWIQFTRRFNQTPSVDSLEDLLKATGDMNDLHDPDMYNLRNFAARYGRTKETFTSEPYYVDPINGSDESGSGYEASPFASLFFVPYFFPNRIDHHLQVIIKGDIDAGDLSLTPEFGPDGSLSFIGQAAPVVVSTAHAVTVVTLFAAASQITVAGAPWIQDGLTGDFLRFDTGNAAGECFPIIQNQVNSVQILAPNIGAIAPTDTFSIIRPQHTITINSLNVRDKGPQKVALDHATHDLGSAISFVNLNLDVRGTDKDRSVYLASDTCCLFSFCRILIDQAMTDGWNCPVVIAGEVNNRASVDTTVDSVSQCELLNLNKGTIEGTIPVGLQIHDTDGPNPTGYAEVSMIDTSYAVSMVNRGVVELAGRNYLYECAAGIFNVRETNQAEIFMEFCVPCSDPAIASINIDSGHTFLYIFLCTFLNNNNGANMISWAGDVLEYAGNDLLGLSYSLYGVLIERPCRITIRSNPAAFTGGTANFAFNTVAPLTTHAWPAVNAAVADTLGSFVNRMS